MDIDTFLAKLSATRARLWWTVNEVGWLRGVDADGGAYCPVTAVCGGLPWNFLNWDSCGQAAGLSAVWATRIVRAADHPSMGIPSRHHAALRAQLLAAVGIVEGDAQNARNAQ